VTALPKPSPPPLPNATPRQAVAWIDSEIRTMWSWQRDGVAERLAIRTTGATLGAVFGEGEDARVFMTSGSTPGSVVVAP